MDHVFEGDSMMSRKPIFPSLLLCIATVAYPCGGSEVYFVDGPLLHTRYLADRALAPMWDFRGWPRDEIRFLPGLLHLDSTKFRALVGRAPHEPYAYLDSLAKPLVSSPNTLLLDAAWTRGDLAEATRAANEIVAGVMALPAEMDSARDVALLMAVETIELAPKLSVEPYASRHAAFQRLAAPMHRKPLDSVSLQLARDPASPRRASIEYAGLRIAMRDRIPDGSHDDLGKQVAPAVWDELHVMHRDWLARYSTHPYAGLVKFSRLRLFFLASQADSAWSTAVSLYDQYPARASVEMRYLLLTGVRPPMRLLTDSNVPIELRTALIGNVSPTAADWDVLMRAASRAPAARWATTLEERLLAVRVTDLDASPTLPGTFPSWRSNAPPLWRYMWAANLVRAGRADDAVVFTRTPITLRQDSVLAVDAAMLSARIHMLRGDWASAVSVPLLDDWTRRYILRVLAPDSVARVLGVSPTRSVAREARLVLAMRAAQAGRWDDAAAQVRSVDAGRAARYAQLGVLSRDTVSNAGLLRFARAMSAAHGQLFFEATRFFYRGMVSRDYELSPERAESAAWDLPWTRADERRRMYAYLRDGAERYLGLKLYASYLSRAGVTAVERRAAVRSADQLYRGLIATDPSRATDGYWADSLPRMPEAAVVRRAGRG
jgi:hypothetical protein